MLHPDAVPRALLLSTDTVHVDVLFANFEELSLIPYYCCAPLGSWHSCKVKCLPNTQQLSGQSQRAVGPGVKIRLTFSNIILHFAPTAIAIAGEAAIIAVMTTAIVVVIIAGEAAIAAVIAILHTYCNNTVTAAGAATA